MEYLPNKKYKMRYHDRHTLEKLRFDKCHMEDGEIMYVKTFSVYKYKTTTLLWGEFTVSPTTGRVQVNIIDNKRDRFYPAYFKGYGNFEPLVTIINNKIENKLKAYKIREVKRKK